MRNAAAAALVAYLTVLVVLTFMPIGDPESVAARQLNLVAFKTIGRALHGGVASRGFVLLTLNVAAFVPLGILLPLALRRRSLVMVTVAAFAVSATIEIAQYGLSRAAGFAYRTTDVDDVILNVTGALLGFAILVLVEAVSKRTSSGG